MCTIISGKLRVKVQAVDNPETDNAEFSVGLGGGVQGCGGDGGLGGQLGVPGCCFAGCRDNVNDSLDYDLVNGSFIR